MSSEEQIMQLQERLDNLETRTAFQDDIIEQLNNEIAVHQEQLLNINEQLRLIGQRVKDLNSSPMADQEDETPPPHY